MVVAAGGKHKVWRGGGNFLGTREEAPWPANANIHRLGACCTGTCASTLAEGAVARVVVEGGKSLWSRISARRGCDWILGAIDLGLAP